jgi:hypothetical protein
LQDTILGAAMSGFQRVRLLNGSLDDVRLYNSTLSAAQIAALATP